ncbi:uncharacterized protein LOC144910671 isoform X1 [Branchiostoma floridae x Branchiostoma belcheri]
MKLFVCMLLVTIVVMATLIDDSEGWRRRRRRRRSGLQADTDADSDLREVMEEARALLEELNEQPEQLDTREMDDMDVENLLADQEEGDGSAECPNGRPEHHNFLMASKEMKIRKK